MFQSFEYFSTIVAQVPDIKTIYRCSGISSLEEVLTSLKSNPDCCLVCRDSGDGKLNLKDQEHSNTYHTIYVMVEAAINDHDARLAAKRRAFADGVAIFKLMATQCHNFGDPAYGFDASNIDYAEIGPVAMGYYGYSFGFTVSDYL